jgi:hypothetical protein
MSINLMGGIVLVGALCTITAVWAEENSNAPALAKAISGASVTLQQGLTAGATDGKAISAKYEIDEGASSHSLRSKEVRLPKSAKDCLGPMHMSWQ